MDRPRSDFVRRSPRPAVILAALLLTTACSATGGSGRSSGNPDVITREQFEDLTGETAYQIVQRLRPTWLRARDQGTLANPEPAYAVVFIDGTRFGPIEYLGRVSPSQIEEIRHIDARDATIRYGGGYPGGIIDITTRSRRSQADVPR